MAHPQPIFQFQPFCVVTFWPQLKKRLNYTVRFDIYNYIVGETWIVSLGMLLGTIAGPPLSVLK